MATLRIKKSDMYVPLLNSVEMEEGLKNRLSQTKETKESRISILLVIIFAV
jgi:hypothetical protein